jgi:hypothetical protein
MSDICGQTINRATGVAHLLRARATDFRDGPLHPRVAVLAAPTWLHALSN